MRTRGAVIVVVAAVCAVIGAALFIFKPAVFHGDSKRAAESTTTTQKLETATIKADDAAQKQGAEAAASVATIAAANASAPDSKQKDFIAQEAPVALGKLPAPDPLALLAAEQRRSAIMEGRLDEARNLYAAELKHSAALQQERDAARADREAAFAQRRAVDTELTQVAAERLGAERQRNQMIAVAVLAIALFLYVKFTHLSPGAMADVVHDIRVGKVEPIAALDGATTRLQQKVVSWLAHFKTKS